MPSKRIVNVANDDRDRTVKCRKHFSTNLRRAHATSCATWNVQVVRGKMSSKCLWHACRALILGIILLLLGAAMATIGYYTEYLTMELELQGNASVGVKNDFKDFHLNNFAYVGPIIMGFGGFIVVASCVMTFEARDSAAKIVPSRSRITGSSKITTQNHQNNSIRQKNTSGTRWEQTDEVYRSLSTEVPPNSIPILTAFDREVLTAEFIKFSKALNSSVYYSPQLRRVTLTGSMPNLYINQKSHPFSYTTSISHLLSPYQKIRPLIEHKRSHHRHRYNNHHYHHHHHNHNHHHHHNHNNHYNQHQYQSMQTANERLNTNTNITKFKNSHNNNNNYNIKQNIHRNNHTSCSLIQRSTRDKIFDFLPCSILQPPNVRRTLYNYYLPSFDDNGHYILNLSQLAEKSSKSDIAKKHILARQKPIEYEEDKTDKSSISPYRHRRNSNISDLSYNNNINEQWTTHCAMNLHSIEPLTPKSILRSPKRFCSNPSATSSIEKEFRSQFSVCSEPPMALRQISGQSTLEPCLPEETIDVLNETSSDVPSVCKSNFIKSTVKCQINRSIRSLPSSTDDHNRILEKFLSNNETNIIKKKKSHFNIFPIKKSIISLHSNQNESNNQFSINFQRSISLPNLNFILVYNNHDKSQPCIKNNIKQQQQQQQQHVQHHMISPTKMKYYQEHCKTIEIVNERCKSENKQKVQKEMMSTYCHVGNNNDMLNNKRDSNTNKEQSSLYTTIDMSMLAMSLYDVRKT